MANINPEALHDVGQDLSKKVVDNFVNPGTPSAPLVKFSQMTHATIKGADINSLKAGIVK